MINTEAMWQLLRTYYVGGELLNGIRSMYVNYLVCRRVDGCRKRGIAANASKSREIVPKGEEGLVCEFFVDRRQFEQVFRMYSELIMHRGC